MSKALENLPSGPSSSISEAYKSQCYNIT